MSVLRVQNMITMLGSTINMIMCVCQGGNHNTTKRLYDGLLPKREDATQKYIIACQKVHSTQHECSS